MMNQGELIQQPGSVGYLVNNEKDIPYIEGNVPANGRIIDIITYSTFPVPVEIDPDHFTVCIEYGTA